MHCDVTTDDYDKLIIPLLHRMMNLENLDLFLRINRDVGLVDGNELKKNIINHMQQLNKCTFNIYSRRCHPVQTNLPLNEETQHIFQYFPVSEIISCIDYFPEKQYSQCLIYSYPYKLKFYQGASTQLLPDLHRHSAGKF